MMTVVRKFLRLRSDQQRLPLEALVLVLGFRIGLWVHSWKKLSDRSRLSCDHKIARGQSFEIARLEWAVRHASRIVPRASCLTQALVLQRLLSRFGHCAALQIGVA